MNIVEMFKELKMNGALRFYQEELEEGNLSTCDEQLTGLLKSELEVRGFNKLTNRLRVAKFPSIKDWTEIDEKVNPKIPFAKIKQHCNGQFIQEKRNLCFIGTPGVGKTHCILAIGRELCRRGHSIRFYTAAELVIQLEEANASMTLSKLMKKLAQPHLLIIDELGFTPLKEQSARLLFDVFSRRYEVGSIAVTTNLSTAKWAQIFANNIELTAALVDRFTHRTYSYTFLGESCRYLQSKKEKANRQSEDT
jgi:DNA replication protein DnaC